ncbi:MAG: hypothetical protein Q8K60_01690 [Parachlamydiaceae bacterium]|nr:hypothetical protein [Parachlamydiaceae bacterium]
MFKLTSFVKSIGLEQSTSGIKVAILESRFKDFVIQKLYYLKPEQENVKQLYIKHPFLSTGMSGMETLVRSLFFPLTKEKDISAALSFQSEPLLPYPVEEALLTYQITEKLQEGTIVSIFSVKQEALKNHIEEWQKFKIEPEVVTSIPWALSQFGSHFFPDVKNLLILNVQRQEMNCVLIREKKLISCFALSVGLDSLLKNQTHLNPVESLPQSESDWSEELENHESDLGKSLVQLKRSMIKMSYALAKELKSGESIDGVVVTGEISRYIGLGQCLAKSIKYPYLECPSENKFSSDQISQYAISIGLAIAALPSQETPMNFRQDELAYPNSWQRFIVPLFFYYISIFLLCASIYFFTKYYTSYHEDIVKQEYVEMLSGMNKSYDQFESAFFAKNRLAREQFQGEVPDISELSMEDIQERLAFLQSELQATPDSFPLFANIPRVSDVLGWLSRHEAVVTINESGEREHRLSVENFSYTMVKRPQQGKKQEKYQVKIELEISTPTPKWAREFHDALITPNDWVDPKGEVKWSSNNGKYKTSFFLKDKTIYPGL